MEQGKPDESSISIQADDDIEDEDATEDNDTEGKTIFDVITEMIVGLLN